MNAWQKRFAQRMELVRNVSRERFTELARNDLEPVFEEFRDFTFQQGLHPSTPLDKAGIRTYKFALTENTFLLLTFRLKGLEHCEMLAEHFVPRHEKLPPLNEAIELAEVNRDWVRRLFEQALERFVEACVEAFAGRKPTPQLAVSHS